MMTLTLVPAPEPADGPARCLVATTLRRADILAPDEHAPAVYVLAPEGGPVPDGWCVAGTAEIPEQFWSDYTGRRWVAPKGDTPHAEAQIAAAAYSPWVYLSAPGRKALAAQERGETVKARQFDRAALSVIARIRAADVAGAQA